MSITVHMSELYYKGTNLIGAVHSKYTVPTEEISLDDFVKAAFHLGFTPYAVYPEEGRVVLVRTVAISD